MRTRERGGKEIYVYKEEKEKIMQGLWHKSTLLLFFLSIGGLRPTTIAGRVPLCDDGTYQTRDPRTTPTPR